MFHPKIPARALTDAAHDLRSIAQAKSLVVTRVNLESISSYRLVKLRASCFSVNHIHSA